MNWITNLCSCISPTLKNSIIDYLNSSNLNSQVIQEEKCTEEERQNQPDPSDNVYNLAKRKSYNFMKLQQHSDEENDSPKQKKNKNSFVQDEVEDPEQIMDVFWYPVNKVQNKWEQYRSILNHKTKNLQIILSQEPSSSNYDKVYDSQDEIKLVIYCRLESLVKGKKINSYRFSFQINNLSLPQFKQWIKQVKEGDIVPLLSEAKQIERDPQDNNLYLQSKQYKKLLVINPHQFLTAQKLTIKESQESKKEIIKFVSFSIKKQAEKSKQQNQNGGNGWLHLFGVDIAQTETGLVFNGYMSIELEVSISPSMLKQPISKQIRICVQKMICNLKKSDEI